MRKLSSALIGITAFGAAQAMQAESGSGAVVAFTLAWPANVTVPTPASIDVPFPVFTGEEMTLYRLVDGERHPVACQQDPVLPQRFWWMAVPGDVPGRVRYELQAGKQAFETAVTARADDEVLRVSVRGKPVLVYHHAPVPPPPGKSERYTRSGFIHPLYSPAGEELTTIHPPDHTHHLGLWHPWTSTEFEGRHVDFWNLAKGEGTVRFVAFETVSSGPVFGGFRAIHQHVALQSSKGEQVVLEEVWDVRVWNVPGPAFLVDMTSTQRCVADSPLLLQAYRYGGLGFRGRLGWGNANSDYLTSEGKTRVDGHGTRARWCHVYGETPAGGAGVLFMSYPENREHPEPMRLWPPDANHGKDNVFFNFCPVQKTPWTLEPGKSYVLKYRLQVYEGSPSKESAERQWQAFATPPVCHPAGGE